MEKKWKIVFDYLLELIKTDQVKAGEALPSQNRLKTRFKYSDQPIRIAFDKLVSLNIVEAHQGKGFIVCEKTRNNILFSFSEMFPDAKSEYLKAELITIDKNLEKRTGFICGSKVYRVEVKRFLKDIDFIFQISWLNAKFFANFNFEILKQNGLMNFMKNHSKTKVSHAIKKIYFQKETDDLKISEWFNDNKTNQAIVDQGKVFDLYNEQIEYRESFYQPEFFKWEFIEWRK
ncbi:GntR family transcriptional regulator [Spiroplasma alleghenense]|uniref:GntR family transcriptional regulator n=1 Tax=Spiroplasma alleghenense TaxID=216931 RepID=A0A345Z5A7_9MOLU|nr:GntR family transcriptional regulator [Spiroplasma alleghenense]AXK51786.1 GntR family transcriptional regulator [Spiroplasma alleghenense]